MDVISAWQAGIRNITAYSGKWISDEQLKLVKKFTNNICRIPDKDAIDECNKNNKDLLKQGFNVEILILKEKDIDEMINA